MGQAFEPEDTAEGLFKIMSEKTIDDTGKFSNMKGMNCLSKSEPLAWSRSHDCMHLIRLLRHSDK